MGAQLLVASSSRFCSDEDAGENGVTLTSASNIVPIITYNRLYETETVLEYRIGKLLETIPYQVGLISNVKNFPFAVSSGPSPSEFLNPRPLPPVSSTICMDLPS